MPAYAPAGGVTRDPAADAAWENAKNVNARVTQPTTEPNR
jgi:hypothetical protein